MKKGISTIIASIILVVITIGLISTAYLYFSSIVTVGSIVSIASAHCDSSGAITVAIRNDGTANLNVYGLTWIVEGTQQPTPTCGTGTLVPGNSTTCELTAMVIPGVNNIVAIGPKNQAGGPVTCP